MNKNHFHEDGEPKNGIVSTILDEIVSAVAGMYVNRNGTFRGLTDDQFNNVVLAVAVALSANIDYKLSFFWSKVQFKRTELEELAKKSYKNNSIKEQDK